MAMSSRNASSNVASRHRKRPSNGRSNSRKGDRESNKKNNPSEKKKKNHLLHLRSITARLLREDSEIRSTPYDETSKNANSKTKHKSNHKKTIKNATVPEPFQKIRPWVETSKIEEESMWVEASPIEILSVQQPSDTITDHTTLCSALEMLSFENFCNAGHTSVEKSAAVVATGRHVAPLKVVGHSPAEDDGFMVPREIRFENHNVCGGCVDGGGCMRKEESHIIKKRRPKNVFMKRLLPFKAGKVDNDIKVMKVKVYVDPPRPQGSSNNSIGNSTLTMPKELQRNATITTI